MPSRRHSSVAERSALVIQPSAMEPIGDGAHGVCCPVRPKAAVAAVQAVIERAVSKAGRWFDLREDEAGSRTVPVSSLGRRRRMSENCPRNGGKKPESA